MNRTPVVFIHGAWLHALSWEAWAERFANRGFLALAPGWPEEGATAQEARRLNGTHARLDLDALTDHYADIARSLGAPPVIIGHSIGGLIAQHLLAAGIGRAAAALAPAPINDVPLHGAPLSLRSSEGDGTSDPLVELSREQFHHWIANTVTAEESDRLYERYAVPAPRRLLTDLGCDGAARSPLAGVDTDNANRGPLLLISGQEDRLVPDSVTRTVYKQYGDSTAVTDLKQFADRAHSMVVDGGWRFVADYVLGWLEEHGVRPLGSER